ncbi:MAG: hypothetical protein K6U89_19530, partial [Chloroflexi bacterium]|nr:hypothetical protein [Chloroflexota bacterium]
MPGKVASMRDAIAELVRDGDTVAIEGFTHLICFAAGHEIIRQRKRDLVLARLTPDLVYDQMVAAGVARKLIFSWLGNPGVGSLHAIRRRTEGEAPSLELEEYSHFGMVARYTAGAANLPFFPIRSYFETDLPKVNPNIRPIRSPFGDARVAVLGVVMTYQQLFIILVTGALIAAVWLFLQRTQPGKALRAMSQNRDAARLVGINPDRIALITFALAGALAGMAGALVSPLRAFDPHIGALAILKSFAIVIFGGMGSVAGALLGTLIVGLAETM